MLGAVGDDQLGVSALEALRENDVQTDHVAVRLGRADRRRAHRGGARRREPDLGRTGRERHPPTERRRGCARVARPHLLLVSLEVPERTVRAAVGWSHDHDVTIVLNPAPPRPWAKDLAALSTYVTPNEHEREALGAVPPDVVVIETCGAAGAAIHHPDGTEERVSAPPIEVVDTTGAGDCFNGVLVAGLAWGTELVAAVHDAVLAASLSVGTAGAREGMPGIEQIGKRENGSVSRARARPGTPRRARARTHLPGPSPGCSTRSTRRRAPATRRADASARPAVRYPDRRA